jgi:hypothetical protein
MQFLGCQICADSIFGAPLYQRRAGPQAFKLMVSKELDRQRKTAEAGLRSKPGFKDGSGKDCKTVRFPTTGGVMQHVSFRGGIY